MHIVLLQKKLESPTFHYLNDILLANKIQKFSERNFRNKFISDKSIVFMNLKCKISLVIRIYLLVNFEEELLLEKSWFSAIVTNDACMQFLQKSYLQITGRCSYVWDPKFYLSARKYSRFSLHSVCNIFGSWQMRYQISSYPDE
jgi:hypothetical protein